MLNIKLNVDLALKSIQLNHVGRLHLSKISMTPVCCIFRKAQLDILEIDVYVVQLVQQ